MKVLLFLKFFYLNSLSRVLALDLFFLLFSCLLISFSNIYQKCFKIAISPRLHQAREYWTASFHLPVAGFKLRILCQWMLLAAVPVNLYTIWGFLRTWGVIDWLCSLSSRVIYCLEEGSTLLNSILQSFLRQTYKHWRIRPLMFHVKLDNLALLPHVAKDANT